MSGINLLALPKGSSWTCEVCRKPGTIRCIQCQKTYYCTKDHKMIDWEAFHKIICKDIAYIRGEHPFPIEEAERELIRDELRKKQMEIHKKAQNIAKEHLLKGNPQFAYAPAMQALHLFEELFTPTSEEIILPYALLSEVYLALGNLPIARDYMLQVSWIAEKTTEMKANLLQEVHRIKGLVFLRSEKWKKAKASFSEYIYCMAELYGTSNIPIAAGFGYLGLTLSGLELYEEALGMYNKMASLWLNYLLDLYISNSLRRPTEDEIEDPEIRETEFHILEVDIIFKEIDKKIQTYPDSSKLDRVIFQMYVVQVMLSFRIGDMEKKEACANSALIVATRTRMENIVKQDKRCFLNELLGDDYLLKWDRKHKRARTIATKYLENVLKMTKKTEDHDFK